jgi:hypothetical protein
LNNLARSNSLREEDGLLEDVSNAANVRGFDIAFLAWLEAIEAPATVFFKIELDVSEVHENIVV